MADAAKAISKAKNRRGVLRSSITKLNSRIKRLESAPDKSAISEEVTKLADRLDTLEAQFAESHFEVVDLLEDEGLLAKEQAVFDKVDDDINTFSDRIQALKLSLLPSHASSGVDELRAADRRLKRIEQSIKLTTDKLDVVATKGGDISLLEQHSEQLADYKRELSTVYTDLINLNVADDHPLILLNAALEDKLFDCSHKTKQLIRAHASSLPTAKPTAPSPSTVSLPRLKVPTFDGELLHWTQFWEQFTVSVHDRTDLSDPERLVYLQQAIKDGPAKTAIEGLARSADHYSDAIECLRSRFDRPRLIHREHVRKITTIPPLKDGTGTELRKLHDTILQHTRALKTMRHEPSETFLTSLIELKLDTSTLFEWQKHTQAQADVPKYEELLKFIDLRAQALETSHAAQPRKSNKENLGKRPQHEKLPSFHSSTSLPSKCPTCGDIHPLYVCQRFKALSHPDMLSTLKEHNLCMNCLGPGHRARQCKSSHRCKKCQQLHHTLLHLDTTNAASNDPPNTKQKIFSSAAVRLNASPLLMTCKVLLTSPDNATVEARALLDNGSSTSFVSERLVQTLRLSRTRHNIHVLGIAGSSPQVPLQSVAKLKLSSTFTSDVSLDVSAIVVPTVTCDLPVSPVHHDPKWTHLSDLQLADPTYGQPGRIDIILGIDVFLQVLRHGRRNGPTGAPVAIETDFGWVLAGGTECVNQVNFMAITYHTSVITDDDLLKRFWESEEAPTIPLLSPEEAAVVSHFDKHHYKNSGGRYVVPLPKKQNTKPIGESRSQAVRRFLAFERSLSAKKQTSEFNAIMKEYLDLGHAELVPLEDSNRPLSEVFYMPIHVVYKTSSTTTKMRAVFDGSALSSTGVSLNDTLLIGPTVHPPLLDVVLRFRWHRIALKADVSKMYRAIELDKRDRDLHRFVWRSSPEETLKDYRMTRVTFGISASSFAANMSIKQNAIDLAEKYPLASEVVQKSFYVDDCLTGADSTEEALILQQQLHGLFTQGQFLLRKWCSNDPSALRLVPADLQEKQENHHINDVDKYTTTLGLVWNTVSDELHVAISELSPVENVTKRKLVSDIAKVFDALGWLSPVTVKMKIQLQRVWELSIGWDDLVPETILSTWIKWRSELGLLKQMTIPRCHYPREVTITSVQLHGFSDASEDAYAGVVYLRLVDSSDVVHTSLVLSKTKVAPLKRITIPRLELCGAVILAKLLQHVKIVQDLTSSQIYAWSDSMVVLGWLKGSPRRFKTYVGNRVSSIVDKIPSDRWRHVPGESNPADCASRGVYPSQLIDHELWWKGPPWLRLPESEWPTQSVSSAELNNEEEREVCHVVTARFQHPIIPPNQYSTFSKLSRVTAWILRFAKNCRVLLGKLPQGEVHTTLTLSTSELTTAENYWFKYSQQIDFSTELSLLRSDKPLSRNSHLRSLHPILDPSSIIRVGGRQNLSNWSYSKTHPIILHGRNSITKLIIWTEHLRMIHAGPNLLLCSLARRFYIIGMRKTVRSVTRSCITCRRQSVKPQPQLLGQLPSERVTPDMVFDKVGVDYAGPILVKYGMVRKPTVVKAYVCIFVSLSTKAVHLEVVSDLTTAAFIATLRRFVARRGHPQLIWSDNGKNFIGADHELRELYAFLSQQRNKGLISQFCAINQTEWRFIPERSPNFGGLWEAAVKSAKSHLRKVVGSTKLTFEELTTLLTQIEACLNSRPLMPINAPDDDGVEPLTPGHFLIGRPLCAIPDRQFVTHPISLLRRWSLCQNLLNHFWARWSSDYLSTLNRFNKWHYPTRNFAVGDVVLLKEDGMLPTRWPLGRVMNTFQGKDNRVRVLMIKTPHGIYKRNVNRIALLIPQE